MGLHYEQVRNHKAGHSAECLTLNNFHNRNIVYFHFPSKTLIAEIGLQSKKINIYHVGPLYVYSKYDKFQFVLSTLMVR